MKKGCFLLIIIFSLFAFVPAQGENDTLEQIENVESFDRSDGEAVAPIVDDVTADGNVAAQKVEQGEEPTTFEKVLAWIAEFFSGTGSAFGVVMMIIGVVESLLLLLPTPKPYSIVKAIRQLLESFIRDRRTKAAGGGVHPKRT